MRAFPSGSSKGRTVFRWRQGRALTIAALSVGFLLASACGTEPADDLVLNPGAPPTKTDDGTFGRLPESAPETILDTRVVDYGAAFRTASLKLVDLPPTLSQIKELEASKDPKTTYETLLASLFDDSRFQTRMVRYFSDVFRQGGGALNSTPTFAARVLTEGRPYQDLFTAEDNTCPSYQDGAFVDGDCDNGVAEHAGVLTNPGTMAQFYGNMAFRRVRWVQEMFVCTKFPAEYGDTPVEQGAGQYTGPWAFDSISESPIDFQDDSSVICANCHVTMNRLAPLFANFDEDGQWQSSIQVMTPTAPDSTVTELSHWLRDGESTAWRYGQEVADLPALGQALADDPDVRECLTARLWNFAMSKEDIVSGLATVPSEVLDIYVSELADNGGDLGSVLESMMMSEDFVSF